MNKIDLEISYHALERFQERVFNMKPESLIDEKERIHLSRLITEDIGNNHAYIGELGTGQCYSSDYNIIYQVQDFVVLTVKKIENKDYREKAGGRLSKKCKQTKTMKNKSHSETKYGKKKNYSNLN